MYTKETKLSGEIRYEDSKKAHSINKHLKNTRTYIICILFNQRKPLNEVLIYPQYNPISTSPPRLKVATITPTKAPVPEVFSYKTQVTWSVAYKTTDQANRLRELPTTNQCLAVDISARQSPDYFVGSS